MNTKTMMTEQTKEQECVVLNAVVIISMLRLTVGADRTR